VRSGAHLRHIRLAESNCTRRAHPCRNRRVFRWHEVPEERGAEGRPHVLRQQEILVGDNQSVQRTGLLTAGKRVVGRLGPGHRARDIQRHDRVDDGIDLFDPGETGPDQVSGGHDATAQQIALRGRRKEAQIRVVGGDVRAWVCLPGP